MEHVVLLTQFGKVRIPKSATDGYVVEQQENGKYRIVPASGKEEHELDSEFSKDFDKFEKATEICRAINFLVRVK